jgi:hypothetical protein
MGERLAHDVAAVEEETAFLLGELVLLVLRLDVEGLRDAVMGGLRVSLPDGALNGRVQSGVGAPHGRGAFLCVGIYVDFGPVLLPGAEVGVHVA